MIIQQPKNPLPPTFRPTGGQPYKVKDTDNWWSLAKTHKVDAWWLIQYNFETRSPAEVNWYLKNRVGCDKTTPDKKNYKFSSTASPGIIYVPPAETTRNLQDHAYRRFGLIIRGDEDYKLQITSTLNWVARADTGMVLLEAVRRTGKEIEISPWDGLQCNATASSTNIRDATGAGETILRGGRSFEQVTEPDLLRDVLGLPKEAAVGTGAGSAAKVKFSPSMFGFGSSGPCATFAGAPGASPSQVLFHELAHAYRFTIGKFNPRPTVGGSTTYTNMEEFFAVVISNVLTSDPTYSTGNRTLRADHSGFAALSPALSTSTGFVSQTPNRNKMRELVASDPYLAKQLAQVKSYFNPFAVPLH